MRQRTTEAIFRQNVPIQHWNFSQSQWAEQFIRWHVQRNRKRMSAASSYGKRKHLMQEQTKDSYVRMHRVTYRKILLVLPSLFTYIVEYKVGIYS